MNRRNFLKTVGLAAGSIMMPQLVFGGQKSARKPNIIFILADDLGYGDLGCYGQTKIQTPNLDKMAAEGMRFTDFYAGSTVCAPSRNSLMTGEHTGHTHIRGNRRAGPATRLPPGTVTVAELLKKAGYRTACVGKWGLGEARSSGAPNKQGFDYFYGYLNQLRAHNYYPSYLWRNNSRVHLDNEVERSSSTYNGETATKRVQYSHDLFSEEAMDFVKRNRQKPFFLYLAYTIPHASLEVPADSMEQYKGKFPEQPYPDSHYRGQKTPLAAYAAMVSRMDRDIGKLLALLKQLGLDEDTLVMFSSDNGPHKEGGNDPDFFGSNGPLKGYKRDLYEGGIRVPMIARWPGKIKAGSVSNHIAAFWDFLPTATEIAGAKSPPNIDGISFLPTLLGNRNKQRKHDFMYWEFHGSRASEQAVRMGDYKAVRHSPAGPIELYNLKNDIGEENDIADKNPEVIAKIEKYLKRARTALDLWPMKRGTLKK